MAGTENDNAGDANSAAHGFTTMNIASTQSLRSLAIAHSRPADQHDEEQIRRRREHVSQLTGDERESYRAEKKQLKKERREELKRRVAERR